MKKHFLIFNLFVVLYSCNHNKMCNHTNVNIIDTVDIDTILVYCNRFYNDIYDRVPLIIYEYQPSIQEVMNAQVPYLIISNKDTIDQIKKIFNKEYIIKDSTEYNYKTFGNYFLVIKNGDKLNFISYYYDSIWNYNQKYTLIYKTNPMHELLKLQNIEGIDCLTKSDSSAIYSPIPLNSEQWEQVRENTRRIVP